MDSKHLGLVWYGDQWKHFTGFKDTGKNKQVKVERHIGFENVLFPLYKLEINNRWREITSDCIKRLPMGGVIREYKDPIDD